MVRGGVALVPHEHGLLQLVGGAAEDGQPDRQLCHELGVVGRVHLRVDIDEH